MTIERSRALRTASTPPERKLWQLLRSLKPLGFHFRRQVPVGKYIADFARHHARLIVEADGDTHGGDAAAAYDRVRDDFLRAAGYDVLRLTNRDVLHNLDGVGIAIEHALQGRAALPTPTRLPPPSPHGGGAQSLAVPSSPSPLRGGTKGGGPATGTTPELRRSAGQRAFRKAT
jgi:very-short-patch-repair endonuclease